jgi:large subunit ribosomal protein L13
MSDKVLNKKILKSTRSVRPKTDSFQRSWYVLDLSKENLGRVASQAARILIGKNRADYSPDVNMGGVVVIINADKPQLTGYKAKLKNYLHHTGYPGGLKGENIQEVMATEPTKVIYEAIRRMLPKDRHQDHRLLYQLKLVSGTEHNFTQQMIPAN